MWTLPLNRRGLVELLAAARATPLAVEQPTPPLDLAVGDQIVALWPVHPEHFGATPAVVVVPDETHRDWLAWLATYVREMRPFTAFCRVVGRSVVEQFVAAPSAPSLFGTEGICAGLVLGEVLTRSRGRPASLDITSSQFSGTLSYAIGRALALTGTPPVAAVTRAWRQAQELTGVGGAAGTAAAVQSVWSVALGAFDRRVSAAEVGDVPCVVAWSDFATTGEIRDLAWSGLVEGIPDVKQFRALTRLPREQRLEGIETGIRALVRMRKETGDRKSFLAAYLVSLLSPGSVDHAELLAPVATTLPTVFLWYGLFAGADRRGATLPANTPLARRVLRDLRLPDRLVDRPRCDIALEEFALYGGVQFPVPLAVTPGRLDIDLLPGVTMSVCQSPAAAVGEESTRRDRDAEVLRLAAEMHSLAIHQRALSERLREFIESTEARPPLSNPRRRKSGP